MDDGSGIRYLLGDHLGSVIALLDGDGDLIAGSEQRYYPFGAPRMEASTEADWSFTGQRTNSSDFGLMDFNARFISPTLGRFVQPDILIPDFLSPQSFNRYSYVINRPIIFVDPSGHCYGGSLSDDGNGIMGCWDEDPANYWNAFFNELETEYSIDFTGDWTFNDKVEVGRGAKRVGEKLGEEMGLDAGEAFSSVFEDIEFRWMDDVCNLNEYGTNVPVKNGYLSTCEADAFLSPGVVRFWSLYWAEADGIYYHKQSTITAHLAVHELGHVFNTLTSGNFENAIWTINSIRTREGFGFGESKVISASEISADYFLNYVYGSFTGSRSVKLQQALNDDWARLINLAINH
jgi:RHS repeat-associated protein